MELLKICEDASCSQKVVSRNIYLKEDAMMIVKTKTMNSIYYLQVLTKSNEKVYLVPFQTEVIQSFNPFAGSSGSVSASDLAKGYN